MGEGQGGAMTSNPGGRGHAGRRSQRAEREGLGGFRQADRGRSGWLKRGRVEQHGREASERPEGKAVFTLVTRGRLFDGGVKNNPNMVF